MINLDALDLDGLYTDDDLPAFSGTPRDADAYGEQSLPAGYEDEPEGYGLADLDAEAERERFLPNGR